MLYNEVVKLMNEGIMAAPDIYEAITSPTIKSNAVGLHARVLNHWKSKDLLLVDTNYEKHEHQMFSFVEYVWLNIIIELRKYNVRLDLIQTLKKGLFIEIPFSFLIKETDFINIVLEKFPEESKKEFLEIIHNPEIIEEVDKSLDYPLLNFFIMDILTKQKPISILVNAEGQFYPFSIEDFEELKKDSEFIEFYNKTFISVSLSDIISNYLKISDLKFTSKKLKLISDKEAELIHIIRKENAASIKVRFDDSNEIRDIEIEDKIDKIEKEARLLNYIIKDGYQTIELKTQNGQIVHCRNLRKLRL